MTIIPQSIKADIFPYSNKRFSKVLALKNGYLYNKCFHSRIVEDSRAIAIFSENITPFSEKLTIPFVNR